MNKTGYIPGLEPDEWSNDACRGYVIMDMQDCGFSSKDIQRVLTQLYEVFDFHTLEQAKQKYDSGNYEPRGRMARSGENSKGGTFGVPSFDISPQDKRK